MKQLIRTSFLFLAGIICLLHSLVPHHHIAENHSETALVQNLDFSITSFFDFVFHEDLGNKHLENFPTPQPLALDDFSAFELEDVLPSVWSLAYSQQTIFSVKLGFDQTFTNKGPPALA